MNIARLPVIVTAFVLKEHYADEIVPDPWVIHWFKGVPARWHPRSFRLGRPLEREQALALDGKVFVTGAGLSELRKLLPGRRAP